MSYSTTLGRIAAAWLAACLLTVGAAAQSTVSLDSCRAMALHNNKQLRQAQAKVEVARWQERQARAAYLPSFDLEAGYVYNSRQLALIEDNARLPVYNFDLTQQTYVPNPVINPMTQEPVMVNGQAVPQQVAILPKSAMTYNTHHVMGAAVSLTQPIYMGGKIKAMNQITHYAEELARTMRDNTAEDIVYQVDAAYWQVVSLVEKQKLAGSYLGLVQSLRGDVEAMTRQGVATRSNLLTVEVKVNEAQVAQTKVDNGVVLARMLLAQLCGQPIDRPMTLADENSDNLGSTLSSTRIDMNQVYARRHDVHALELATKIADQKALVERSAMLPQLAAVAAYHLTNPNSYNGFKNRFGGAFSVGATLKVPIWHWGGLKSKYRAAQVEAHIRQLELEDAKDRIELQVRQAAFRYQEAFKTLDMTTTNLAKADENLRMADLAFKEGVGTLDDVLAAQTAWQEAKSQHIDAQIDVRLCHVYLDKVMGQMQY